MRGGIILSINIIKPETFLEDLNKGKHASILDIRSEDKVNGFQINHSNAKNINIEKKHFLDGKSIEPEALSSLPKGSEIVIACSTGNSAMKVAERLSEKGFQISVIDGGVNAWKEYINKSEPEM